MAALSFFSTHGSTSRTHCCSCTTRQVLQHCLYCCKIRMSQKIYNDVPTAQSHSRFCNTAFPMRGRASVRPRPLGQWWNVETQAVHKKSRLAETSYCYLAAFGGGRRGRGGKAILAFGCGRRGRGGNATLPIARCVFHLV